MTSRYAAVALGLAGLALTIGSFLPARPGADDPVMRAAADPPQRQTGCAERVFLGDGGSYAWGSITRSSIGPLSVHHVFEAGREVLEGPRLRAIRSLKATDFAFLSGADPQHPIKDVPPLAVGERLALDGFPARSSHRERVSGTVYAPDNVPPGWWIALDHPEPLVGGFSGGCASNADGLPVAVIMGASSMKLDGKTRHFARVIPIRAALREAQGHQWSAPAAFAGPPLPERKDWN